MTLDEAQKLVAIHGLEQSKEIVANTPPNTTHFSWSLGDTGVYDKTVCIAELKRAIEIIESMAGD